MVNGEVAASGRIVINGDVHLILADGCKLDAANGGIQVQDDDNDITNGSWDKLTIYGQQSGTGQLTATGGGDQAAIRSVNADEKPGGIITINGGTITANGGSRSAGIGSCYGQAGGTIIINGGAVTASGGSAGAGIGGGFIGAGGNVTITGGTVIAIAGGGSAAGIGHGQQTADNGTFSTGTDGNAFIVANGGISDKTEQDNWSGIIFEGDTGAVYGYQTLRLDLEIESNQTLTIANNSNVIADGIAAHTHRRADFIIAS